MANSLKTSNYNFDDCIMFCSGVSNSNEKRIDEYKREFKLIATFKTNKKLRFVYFSTVSINDISLENSPYIKFKNIIENYISNTFTKFTIIRLPIVVGEQNNSHQLIGYLKYQISHNQPIVIYKNASRYFFDIRDLPFACQKMIEEDNFNETNTIVNIGFSLKVSMLRIGEIMKKKNLYHDFIHVNKGVSYDVDFDRFEKSVGKNRNKYYSSDPEQMILQYLLF